MSFKTGNLVKLKTPIIVGTILDGKFIDGEMQYLIEYNSADGEIHQRWLPEDLLEAVETAEKE